MKTIYFSLIASAFFGIILSSSPVSAIESPQYEILKSEEVEGKRFELRSYAPYRIAETRVDASSLDEGSREGFRRLAQYIFGGNRSRESMNMTAPVQSEKMAMTAPVGTVGGPGQYTISFVMPSKYTLETLPVPNDPRVEIREVSARKVAAIVFSGFWSDHNFTTHTDALQRYLSARGLEAVSKPLIARYDMPLKPWFLRRNEILMDVR